MGEFVVRLADALGPDIGTAPCFSPGPRISGASGVSSSEGATASSNCCATRAVVYTRQGDPFALELFERPIPEPRLPAAARFDLGASYGSMPSLRNSTIAALRQRTVSGENGNVNGIPFALRSGLPSRRTR